MTEKRLGLIINPVAGIGGRVGLKGSDGIEIQKKALEMGAVPQAQSRAIEALQQLKPVEGLEILTYPGEMGEDAARACSFGPQVFGSIVAGKTTAQDTRDAAGEMQRRNVDLLLFAGGDGTARDIYTAVGTDLPALGVPAGVKIHSAVYATHPRSAGRLVALYLQGKVAGLRELEVMDIDEEAFRQNALSARLYGYLRVPFRSNLVQSQKMIARDASEAQLLALLEEYSASNIRIVITPIGGQGYLFGRGNQQISPQIIQRVGREGIIAVSTPEKLYALGSQPLLVDTGSQAVDEMLSGYFTVVTGYNERAVRKVAC
jgi:predicted polyphosphate/ATP-dependent NAD kinase